MIKITKLKTLAASLVYLIGFSLAEAKDGEHAGHDHSDHEGHDHAEHDHEEIEAPNGGRIIDSVEPHLEFYVDESGNVKITFLNDEGSIVPPGEQKISVIGGDRSNPTRLSFSSEGDALVSNKALPSGNNLPIILNINASSGSKVIREKFNLNLSQCPTCNYKEYACVCEHGEDDDEGDDHGHKGHDH